MKKLLTYLLILTLFDLSCSKAPLQNIDSKKNDHEINFLSTPDTPVNFKRQLFRESFEKGVKSYYANGDVLLSSGLWYLNNALIHREASNQCIRMSNESSIGMHFDVNIANPFTVSIKHAVFNTDSPSSWTLWISDDQGSSYKQVGTTVTCASTTFVTSTFQVNRTGNLRFEIRKSDTGKNRLLLNSFTIDLRDPVTEHGKGPTNDDDNLLLGNPDNAEASVLSPDKYLMDKTYYELSYNNTTHIPNWVSWHLDASNLGSVKRRNSFRPDTYLPASWYQVTASSYVNSGFDRGHDCPSGDRTSSTEANNSTFLMTNIIPQAPQNNQQTWGNLEAYTRSLVQNGNEAYIVMGTYGTGGTGRNGYKESIDDNGEQIKVPSHIWKVIVIIPNGSNDFNRINTGTRVIAVDTPNDNSISPDWKRYRTSVNAIEMATGYNLLSNLPSSIQIALESKVDDL
jgi:endonuclease G